MAPAGPARGARAVPVAAAALLAIASGVCFGAARASDAPRGVARLEGSLPVAAVCPIPDPSPFAVADRGGRRATPSRPPSPSRARAS